MQKVLIETTGPFQLLARSGQMVHAHRPSVVVMEAFFQHRSSIGQLKPVCNNLKPEATDKEFAEYWHECAGDRELAIASFLSKYDVGYVPPVVEEPKKPVPVKAK